MSKKFNIRVYGLLINSKNEILVAHEKRDAFKMTKFPGGGLEWGEGILCALKREFQEELNIQIEAEELFYLTDYYQASAFDVNDQLIAIYYTVKTHRLTLPQMRNFVVNQIKFEWVAIEQLNENDFTFPTDKIVSKKLSQLKRD